MKSDKLILAKNIAFLISISLKSNLAKFLNFCLNKKMREHTTAANILEMTYDLLKNPSQLPYWTQDIMGEDLDYTIEEWKALEEININDANQFIATLFEKL